MYSQQVTKEFVFRQLENLPPESLAEVAQFIEFLQFRAQLQVRPDVSGSHEAFGIWSGYPEAKDPAGFARTLRDKIEKRTG